MQAVQTEEAEEDNFVTNIDNVTGNKVDVNLTE